ncbi:hypothetical protein ACJMK2_031982 [Sinanodonta woodiana]|uniref:Mitochondria-eating protein C-terminal domain-containing protein n=1 Tax=Sinanodonta woodiana TaxID=1069815 RepID=A0ABD3X0G2_SINWO
MGQGRSFHLSDNSLVTRRHSEGAQLKRLTITSELIDESNDPCNTVDLRKRNYLANSSLNSPNRGPKDTVKATHEKNTAALQAEVHQLRTENARLVAICSANLERSDNLNKDYESKIKGLEAYAKQLEEEKLNLFTRLSEIGTGRLTDSNPNIADLSDPNRPSQLAEQFTELYDSEWTDAFEYLSKVKGLENTRTVWTLLNILKTIYNVCFESRQKAKDQLQEAIVSYLGYTDEDKDISVIKKTERMLRECRAKQFEVLLSHATQDIREHLNTQLEGNVHDIIDNYAEKCVRVCWFLCRMDPPMHLDFDANKMDVPQSDDKNDLILLFDEAKFVHYSVKGMYMEYVVWPPLYIYKDGPLLKKGIAQGSNINPVKQSRR